MLESEFVLDIHRYSLLYKPCWPSKPFASARVDHTSERERERKVCVASCSLEAFLFCYSILKSLEFFLKNSKKKNGNKKRGKKSKRQHRRGFVCVLFSFVPWFFVITLVSRLTSLSQFSLGPTYYHY
jgi:hypothetical protein